VRLAAICSVAEMGFQLAGVQTHTGSPRTVAKNFLVSQNYIQDPGGGETGTEKELDNPWIRISQICHGVRSGCMSMGCSVIKIVTQVLSFCYRM
jgi:hypothetical protein